MADGDPGGSYRRHREIIRDFADDLAKLRELHGNPSFEKMYHAIRHDARTAGRIHSIAWRQSLTEYMNLSSLGGSFSR